MRRWLAIAMAALVALGSMAGGRLPAAEAGLPVVNFTFAVDCDTTTGAIDASCTVPSGTTTASADVYVTNNSGSSVLMAAMGVTLRASQLVLTPTVPVSCVGAKLNCNPDFNEGMGGANWACDPVLPDNNPSGTDADSLISCINAVDPPTLPNGTPVRLFRVTYTAVDGVATLSPIDAQIFDETVTELASCNPPVNTSATCTDATLTVGSVVATFTPTSTPTATPTPCVGAGCPTATSLAFRTVTPTPCPVGATDCPTPTGGAEPTTAGEATVAPPPPPPPAGGAPGGTAGGAGAGRITLPDTGEGDDGGSGMLMALLAGASALGALGIASGVWFSARRRQEED
ncbi:MAG: hypothetical protein HY873_12955 [Chloroflexi bacterium]|nr:hypothetical protein [Chloroflexota bacterium]